MNIFTIIVIFELALIGYLVNKVRVLKSAKNHFNDDLNCPICGTLYDYYRHKRVKYHISYRPEKWLYACELCNEIEYLQRSGKLKQILENIENQRKT